MGTFSFLNLKYSCIPVVTGDCYFPKDPVFSQNDCQLSKAEFGILWKG